MRLDKTEIAIRQRPLAELLDLGLLVFRRHALPLMALITLGAAPWLLLNFWLLGGFLNDRFLDYETWTMYVFWQLWLVPLQAPLATAPVTLYLGQVMFFERASWRNMLRTLWSCLPQLLVLQVVLRGFLYLMMITAPAPSLGWPYLNEVLLLERNRLWRKGPSGVTTMGRSRSLHGSGSGELFGRWLGTLTVGVALSLAAWLMLFLLTGVLVGDFDDEDSVYPFTILLPAALWMVQGFLAVVRYLSYLDLRIRTEGWEIELAMRAEAQRMERQLA